MIRPRIIPSEGRCPHCRGQLVFVDWHTNTWCLYCRHPYTPIFWRYRWVQPALVFVFVFVMLTILENFR